MEYISKLENQNSTKSLGYINILTVINYISDIPSAYDHILKLTPLSNVHKDFIPYILCFIQVDNYPDYFVYYYLFIIYRANIMNILKRHFYLKYIHI